MDSSRVFTEQLIVFADCSIISQTLWLFSRIYRSFSWNLRSCLQNPWSFSLSVFTDPCLFSRNSQLFSRNPWSFLWNIQSFSRTDPSVIFADPLMISRTLDRFNVRHDIFPFSRLCLENGKIVNNATVDSTARGYICLGHNYCELFYIKNCIIFNLYWICSHIPV